MKHILFLALLLTIATKAFTQTPNPRFIVGMLNPKDLIRIDEETDRVIPVFTHDGVNAIFDQYTIYSMEQTYPASRFQHMHRYYTIECNDIQLMADLQNNAANIFPYSSEMPEPILLYTPNDLGGECNGSYTDLDLIRAKQAWDVTHGDSNIAIGVTDLGFATTHVDFAGKFDTVRSNNNPNAGHGTIVSSIIGAKTDNSIGISSIGFNCKLDVSDNWGNDNEMLVISNYGRRILNGSWLNGCYSGSYTGQNVYNEVFENGTISCFGAGNGYAHCHFDKAFPASYDHNISVSSVGNKVIYKSKSHWNGIENNILNWVPGCIADPDSMYWNLQDVHENVVGAMDTMADNTIQKTEVHNHNEKVDIVAPGYAVTSLGLPNTYICEGAYGTSFASPLVAGTCGLMLSTKYCLTPYQMEYILKNTAKNIYALSENVQYIGKLGAGRLDAGAAVSMASQYDCNSIYTQTMYIKGIEINTKCIPGLAVNSVLPKLVPIIINGTAPYTYKWEADPIDNSVTLDTLNIATPTVISSTAPHRLHYRLTVYDNSAIQKVASKNIQIDLIDTLIYDFAMRDSYMDMMDEPNTQAILDPRENNNWLSPDIWNRQLQDGIEIPENAEYFVSDSNYAYARVRNVGCISTPSTAKLRMYWTKASTGEVWDADWTTANFTNPQTANTYPAGRQITLSPIDIPAIDPGDVVIFNRGWQPVKPQFYDSTSTATDICLLARIEETNTSPFGMTFPESIPSQVNPNVKNNNNIVTRNMSVVDINPANKKSVQHILVGNIEPYAQAFNLQLINERAINPHFSGDMSQVASVEIKLGALYDRWVSSGMKGTYSSTNSAAKSVIFNCEQTMELLNIRLDSAERAGITLTFTYKDSTVSYIPHTIHFRQYKYNSTDKSIYGNVTFEMNPTHSGSSSKKLPEIRSGIIKDDFYSIYPNPAFDKISIQYLGNGGNTIAFKIKDINGRTLQERGFSQVSQFQIQTFDISKLTAGIYIISIVDQYGNTNNYKIIKN